MDLIFLLLFVIVMGLAFVGALAGAASAHKSQVAQTRAFEAMTAEEHRLEAERLLSRAAGAEYAQQVSYYLDMAKVHKKKAKALDNAEAAKVR